MNVTHHHHRHGKPVPHSQYSFYGWFVCSLAALFYCYEFLLRIEPSVMRGGLMLNYHIGAEGLSILFAVYYWSYTPLQMVVGLVLDYFGPKRVLAVALSFCAVGSYIFGSSHNVDIAALGRMLIGMGSAFAFIGSLKLAAMWLPYNRFALFSGITTALGMIGAITGDIAMSYVTGHYGWHRVVMIGSIIGVVLIPLFVIFIREKSMYRKHMNLNQKLKELFSHFRKLIAHREVYMAGLIGCLLYFSLSVVAALWGIPFVKAVLGVSNVEATTVNTMIFVGWLIGAPTSGWLSSRIQSRRKPLIVGSIAATVFISIVLLVPIHSPFVLGALFFLFGLSCSTQVICFAVGRDAAPLKMAGTATALVNFIVMLAGSVFQPVVGILLKHLYGGAHGIHHMEVYTADAYRHVLLILPLAMIIAAVLSYLLKETYRKQYQQFKTGHYVTPVR